MSKLPVTVVIPVKNEERNLPRCLAGLDRFEAVIVVDSGSTDRTCEIAKAAGATVIAFKWNGAYPKKRNWVLMGGHVTSQWVLFLDADERVTAPFLDEMARAIAAGKHDGFWLNFDNHFLGRKLAHGVPQRKLALFRVGAGLYERIEEQAWSHLDMEVHEHPIIDGAVGEIRAPLEHNDVRGIAHFVRRHAEYATWEASRYWSLHQSGEAGWERLTDRQKFKYRHLGKWWFAGLYFVHTYAFRRGFLDAGAGLTYAFYKAWYFNFVRRLILEQSRERHS